MNHGICMQSINYSEGNITVGGGGVYAARLSGGESPNYTRYYLVCNRVIKYCSISIQYDLIMGGGGGGHNGLHSI